MNRIFVFEVGSTYYTLEGRAVTIKARRNEESGHHAVLGDDGLYRYASRDFGKVVGGSASDPNNILPEMSDYALGIQRVIIEFEEQIFLLRGFRYRGHSTTREIRHLEDTISLLRIIQYYGPSNPNEMTPRNETPAQNSLHQAVHAERFMFDGIHPRPSQEAFFQMQREDYNGYRRPIPVAPRPREITPDDRIAYLGDSRDSVEDTAMWYVGVNPSAPRRE